MLVVHKSILKSAAKFIASMEGGSKRLVSSVVDVTNECRTRQLTDLHDQNW
jgi:hypothetical protein